MCQQHAAAAVALQAELVEGLASVNALLLKELKVLVPLVANNLNGNTSIISFNTFPQVKQRTGMIIVREESFNINL